jgi:RNA polymerase sigma-70 factor (ECF subfamily)
VGDKDSDGSTELVDRATGQDRAPVAGTTPDAGPAPGESPPHADRAQDAAADPAAESRLLRDARAGDQVAFIALLRVHEPRLRALAFRVLREPDGVADVMQETAMRAFRSLHTFRDEASLGTWLFRVTYNACLDHIASRQRQLHLVERSRESTERHEPDVAETVAVEDRLSRALDTLSPQHRAVVYLCLQLDLDLATTATVLDIPYGTVGSRLNHARQVLREALGGDEGR